MHYLCNRKPEKLLFSVLALTLLLIVSCADDRFSDRVRIYPTVLMPLVHGNLTLGNLLLADGSSFSGEQDNTITLVLRADSLMSVSLGETLELPLPDTVVRIFKTGPVRLDDMTAYSSISLGDIAGRIDYSEDSFIRNYAGKNAYFPPLTSRDLGDLSAGKLENIEYALFSSGEIELTARNNLPVEVSMEIRLINEPCRTEVGRFVFPGITPGGTATLSSALDDILVRQSLTHEITAFSVGPSQNEVYIDPDKTIEFNIEVRDLSVVRGKAMLERTLLDTGSDAIVLHFTNDVELQELIMEYGIINYSMENYGAGMDLDVTFRSISKDGEPCRLSVNPNGRGGFVSDKKKLSEVDFDVENNVRILIDYELYAGSDGAEMTEFDLTRETLQFELWFSDFRIGYASGYLGRGEFLLGIDGLDIGLDLFSRISGDLQLTNPTLRIFYENSGGVPADLLLNMSAGSPDGTTQASLFNDDKRVFSISHPREPYTSVNDEIIINRESSNLIDLLSLTPPNVKVEASVLMNPAGRTGNSNFITSESRAFLGMEFIMPLDMQFTDLILTDTLATALGPEDYNIIEDMFLDVQITNSLPGGASVNLELYDSVANRVLHSFGEVMLLESAAVNAEGEVIEGSGVSTETEIAIPENVVDHLRQTTHFIISAHLNSGKYQEGQVPVKFRTVDKLDFIIRLRAGLSVGN